MRKPMVLPVLLMISLIFPQAYSSENTLFTFRSSIMKTSQEYGVNPYWMMAIIMKESGGNPNLYRYEPNFHYFYKPQVFALAHHISLQTEIMSQKTSWGLGSICGGLARELGYQGLLHELLNPDVNIKYIGLYLQHLKKYSLVKDDIFSMYNYGPGGLHKNLNPEYVNGVNAELYKITYDSGMKEK